MRLAFHWKTFQCCPVLSFLLTSVPDTAAYETSRHIFGSSSAPCSRSTPFSSKTCRGPDSAQRPIERQPKRQGRAKGTEKAHCRALRAQPARKHSRGGQRTVRRARRAFSACFRSGPRAERAESTPLAELTVRPGTSRDSGSNCPPPRALRPSPRPSAETEFEAPGGASHRVFWLPLPPRRACARAGPHARTRSASL